MMTACNKYTMFIGIWEYEPNTKASRVLSLVGLCQITVMTSWTPA